jgi:hypothetical protein
VSIDDILEQIQERAGLDRREGHPLFAYRVTEAEESRLGEALRAHFAVQPDGPHPIRVAGAFVLYAASRFCRTHDGGAWSWQEVLEGAGWPQGLGGPLYELVEHGFWFWRCGTVLVSGDRRAFLRSVAVQGGLPLRLLTKESGSLHDFFSRVLSASELYGRSARELAPRYRELLPRTLRQEVVYDLAGSLVDAVVRLRAALPERVADPIAALDAARPGWRSQVPLRIDDEAAAHLLRGLLHQREAASLDLPALADARLVLSLDRGEPHLLRRVELAERVPAERLAERFGVAERDLPPYIALALALPGGGARAVGAAQALVDGSYRLVPDRQRRAVRRGPGLLGTVHLSASAGEQELGVTSIAGGAAIEEDVPWVLRGSEARGELPVRAFGSRTAAEALLALLPPDGELELEDGAELEELPGPARRRFVRLVGSAIFHTPVGERCRLASRAADDPDERYELRGRLKRLGVGGTEAFDGPPRLVRAVGEREQVLRPEEIEWRTPHAGTWNRLADREPRGKVRLRHRPGDEVRFRTTATVLPRDLRFEMEPARAGAGRVSLHHEALLEVRAEPTVGRAEVRRSGDAFDVQVEVDTATTGRLDLDLLFAGEGEAHLEVPLPVEQRAFIGPDGAPLPQGSHRGVERLVALRARAVEAGNRTGACVYARVRGLTGWRRLAELPEVGPRVRELPLQRVRTAVETLLAIGGDLDTTVDLRIDPDDGTMPSDAPLLHVQRQDACLDRERGPEADLLRLDDQARRTLGEEGVRQIRVDARPLDAPDEEQAFDLPEIEPGVWRFAHTSLARGPWLVLGWHDQWCRLRPLLITLHGDEEAPGEDCGPLRRAMRISKADERAAALDAALDGLSADALHPEWSLMSALFETLDRLPVTTFDPVTRLPRHPDALALAVFLQSHRLGTLWPAMERLPFLWATLPVASWVRAAKRQEARAQQLLEADVFSAPEQARQALIAPVLDALSEQSPKLAHTLWGLLYGEVRGCPEPPGSYLAIAREPQGEALLETMRVEAKTRARQRGAHRRWPRVDLPPDLFRHAASLVDLEDVPPYCRSVLAAPAVAALAAVTSRPLAQHEVLALRRARDFDTAYFEELHAISLSRLLADVLLQDPERFDDLA